MAARSWTIVRTALLGVVLGSLGVYGELAFKLGSCDINLPLSTAGNRQGRVLTFSNTRVTPHPIVLPGKFSVTSSLHVFRNITGDIMLDVTVERHFGFFKIPIPCIQGVGSCKYHDVCGLLKNAFPNGAHCPPQIRQSGVPCTCPIKRGTYTLTKGHFRVPHLNSLWAWLAQGDYQAKGILRDSATGEEIACQRLDISIRAPCDNIFCRLFG